VTYIFDTGREDERARLSAHNALWDPFTLRRLGEVGVSDGWCCLEVGAGTGSIARWLVDRVGPTGHVVATEIETRWLEPLRAANLEVRHHDVVHDPLDEPGYDLIHARLVLEHLPRPDAVLAKLADALRPGGWLVVEDYDVRTMGVVHPADPAWTAVHDGVVGVLRAAGVDPLYGSRVLDGLRATGLVDVSAEGFLRAVTVTELAPVFQPVLGQLREPLVAGGWATSEDVDSTLARLGGVDRSRTGYTPLLVSARGRRAGPATPDARDT
jgi:SAM-dependent methyltransferase